MSQLKAVQEKLRLIRILRLLKKSYTYEELSRITGLPITVLNRYVRERYYQAPRGLKSLWSCLHPISTLKKRFARG